MGKYVFFNGKIILEKNVKISFNDLGFARGYGVFDAMRTINGKPFLIKEHYERLQNSAKELNLFLKISLTEFEKIINKLLLRNKIKNEIAIKTILTGGKSSNGLRMDGEPTLLITINDLNKVTPKKELYKKGAKIILVEFQRYLPEAKTLNYIVAIQNQRKKEKSGATEIVYYNKGYLLEGSTSNIFIVKNDKIITPDKNILLGTTRNLLIQLLRKKNRKIEARDVKLKEIFEADEVFLTGTFKNILPIVRMDDKIIGDGKVGEVTAKIMKLIEG